MRSLFFWGCYTAQIGGDLPTFWEDLSGPVRLQSSSRRNPSTWPLKGLGFRAGEGGLSILQILYGPCRRPNFAFYVSWEPFPSLKGQGPKFLQSPLSSAEVQNGWSRTSSPPICFRDQEGDKFTFFLHLQLLRKGGLSYKINRRSLVSVLPSYITQVYKQSGHRIESPSLMSILPSSSHSFFQPQRLASPINTLCLFTLSLIKPHFPLPEHNTAQLLRDKGWFNNHLTRPRSASSVKGFVRHSVYS